MQSSNINELATCFDSNVLFIIWFFFFQLKINHSWFGVYGFFFSEKKRIKNGQSLANLLLCARFNYSNGYGVCRWQRKKTHKNPHIHTNERVTVRTITEIPLNLSIFQRIIFRWYKIYRFKTIFHSSELEWIENVFSPLNFNTTKNDFGINCNWMETKGRERNGMERRKAENRVAVSVFVIAH